MHPYIQAFKVYHFIDKDDVFLVPKGVFEMVFQSQHSFQHNTNYSSGWQLRPRNFVGGLHNQAYRVNSGTGDNYFCTLVEANAKAEIQFQMTDICYMFKVTSTIRSRADVIKTV